MLAGFEYKLWCRFLVIWCLDNGCSVSISSSISIEVSVTQSSRCMVGVVSKAAS